MAYNRGEDIQNKIKKYSLALVCVKLLKFFFFFYSFLSFFFWFLNCFEFEWLYMFQWIFIVPYLLVKTVYKPTGVSADFSLAIIGIISLLVGFLLEFISGKLYKKISDLQEDLEKYFEQRKRTKTKNARPIVPTDNYSRRAGAKHSNNPEALVEETFALIFIIQPHIHKIKVKPNELELTFQEVEIWRQRINKRILENIKYSQPLQKGYYRKNLFIVYKDFNYVDDFVYYIRPTIESIIIEFKKYGIDIKFNYVLSSVVQLSAVEKELDIMDTILSLNFINMFILTDKFKKAYESKTVKKYSMGLKGEYNLSKNLTISNVQPLYMFKEDINKENNNENENNTNGA